jgi:hypothetical protein
MFTLFDIYIYIYIYIITIHGPMNVRHMHLHIHAFISAFSHLLVNVFCLSYFYLFSTMEFRVHYSYLALLPVTHFYNSTHSSKGAVKHQENKRILCSFDIIHKREVLTQGISCLYVFVDKLLWSKYLSNSVLFLCLVQNNLWRPKRSRRYFIFLMSLRARFFISEQIAAGVCHTRDWVGASTGPDVLKNIKISYAYAKTDSESSIMLSKYQSPYWLSYLVFRCPYNNCHKSYAKWH